MKTYTFKINKNNNNRSYNSNNYSLKDTIASNLANKYSWFDAPVSKSTVTYITGNSNSYVDSLYESFNFNNDYAKALAILDNYGKKNFFHSSDNVDEYDYEIDGIPVRIFNNMIQIGYTIIPMKAASSYYFALKPEVKKTIVDITIKIKKSGFRF